jgi:hypothetical protein
MTMAMLTIHREPYHKLDGSPAVRGNVGRLTEISIDPQRIANRLRKGAIDQRGHRASHTLNPQKVRGFSPPLPILARLSCPPPQALATALAPTNESLTAHGHNGRAKALQ